VNTQFTFIDVGVNVEIMPRVHEDGEVSLHVDVEISKVDNTINLGGIDQPVIGQRKVTEDIRLKGGEVNLIGGLVQVQQTKSVTGVPGLSSIPILRRLFTSEDIENSTTELVIALIPHVMRRMDVNRENLRTIAVGNATTVKLNYGPEKATGTPTVAAPAPAAGAPAAAAPAATAPTPPATAPAPPPAPASVQPSPSARFLPAQLDATVGNTVTTTVMLDHVKDLFSAPMHIKFDPKLLRLNDVAQGNLLSSDGQQVVFTKNVLNDSGEATVTLNRMPGASGVSGAGTAVTLTFQAVARGAATVSVPQFAPRDSKGQTLLTASPVLTINIK
jgi:general secretion pathway protein D